MKNNIDCSGTDELVCPYCGYEHSDSWERSDEGDFQCFECEKSFVYTSYTSRTFTSHQAPCLNGGEHDWGNFTNLPECKIRYCRVCDKRDFVNTRPTKEAPDDRS
jgi:hypothetical protein